MFRQVCTFYREKASEAHPDVDSATDNRHTTGVEQYNTDNRDTNRNKTSVTLVELNFPSLLLLEKCSFNYGRHNTEREKVNRSADVVMMMSISEKKTGEGGCEPYVSSGRDRQVE